MKTKLSTPLRDEIDDIELGEGKYTPSRSPSRFQPVIQPDSDRSYQEHNDEEEGHHHPPIGQTRQRFRGSVIGLERCPNPVHLKFEEINFGVKRVVKTRCGKAGMLCPRLLAKERDFKQILYNINGEVLPGQILAIMGPSGAGKTTFLDVLSARVRPTSGAITCNGVPLTPNLFRSIAAFVPQHDLLIPTLTVKETLKFHADLRLPRNSDGKMSKELRKERVHNILRQLRLDHCADTLVGDHMLRGISGGEKRRLSIAIALLTEPGVIFLDEPTSGLDAAMAFDVMASIQDLATSGRSVVFTIHQPRSNIFRMFDKLLLLCKGKIAYYGPANQAVKYFADRNMTCDQFTNPSDFFLDMVVPGESTGQSEEGIEALLNSYVPPPLLAPKSAEDLAASSERMDHALAQHRKMRANWFQQLWSLVKRDVLNQLRNPMIMRVKAMQAIVQGLLFGLIFLQLGYDQQGLQSRQGCIIFFVVCLIFITIQGVISNVPRERAIFYHERDSNIYSVSSYLLSKLITDIPGELFFNFLFCVISYWLVGLNPGVGQFFIFCLFMTLNAFGAIGIGYWIAVVSPDETIALIIAPFCCIFQVLFSGTFLNLGDVPDWGIWIPYWSVTRWAFQALIVNEFDGATFHCSPSDTACTTSGKDVIERYNFGDTPMWACGIIIAGISVGFCFLAYLTLAFKDWLRRRA